MLWQPGMRITDDRLNAITPAFVDWTPTWTTSTGAHTPSLGDATVNCRYARCGDLVVANFEILFGAGTNFNSGTTSDNWRFGLPVVAAATTQAIGFMELNFSTSVRGVARCRLTSTAAFELELSSGRPDGTAVTNNGLADAQSPETWASGDAIRGILQYEAAA
ncbi:hypothetical protein ACGFS9_03125 [Streptomyces sp. NPDC048566]|uniref:hypothetical protein n=1 Tax=Streptomyces sp. NPDC048566 TaxID=3365569 RepID=UPI00372018C2